MKRFLPSLGILLLLVSVTALAQTPGHLVVTVTVAPQQTLPAGPVSGAKVVVVHWTHSQLHPAMIQDALTTTNQEGVATIPLPPGTYDVFITATGLAPAAARIDVESGENAALPVNLSVAPMHLRPTN